MKNLTYSQMKPTEQKIRLESIDRVFWLRLLIW